MDLALNNKFALVTGSHRGTGQIIAKTLLQEGANVLVHGMTQQQAEDSVSTRWAQAYPSGAISLPERVLTSC